MWSDLLYRLRALFRRQSVEAELNEELRAHLEQQVEKYVQSGLPRQEAARRARLEFGGLDAVKEACREARGISFIETLLQDLRYGLRQLRRNPGFTAIVVLSLALGIGANTAIFSLIDAVMLRMLPVSHPEQLMLLNWKTEGRRFNSAILAVESDNGATNDAPFSYPAFEQLHARNRVFSSLFGFVSLGRAEIRIKDETHLAEGEMVTADYFSGLGVLPILGRAIAEQDEKPGAPYVAVISYGYWSRELGRDLKVAGKRIAIDGVPFTIVGVAPPEFFGVQPGRSVDVWIPLIDNSKLLPYGMDSTPGGRSLITSPYWWWLLIMGRLKPGVTAQQASAQVEVLFQQSITAGLKTPLKPASIPNIQLAPAGGGVALLRQQFSKPLGIMMILVGVVLLIACVNVAGLLVARATARQKEVAVRLSLGAARRRLIRQLLTESVLLGSCGGALGLVMATWGSHALLALMSSGGEPLHLEAQVDARVLAFTAAVSVLTGILFGLAPALQSTRVDLTPALKAGASGGSTATQRMHIGLGKSLVVAQVALSLVLLVGAGLFVRTLENLEHQTIGFNQHRLLLFAMDPTTSGYKAERLVDFYGRLLEQLQALPGVRSATLSQLTLISGQQGQWGFSIDGQKPQDGHYPYADFNDVGPSFFATMGIPLLAGRGIDWRDTPSSPKVAVVNAAFARSFLAGANPVGHAFRFAYYNFKAGEFSPAYEIVGMAQNARYASLRKAPRPTVYVPYSQAPFPLGGIHFELRTAGDPLALIPAVRRVVHDLDPDLLAGEFKTQTEQIEETLVQERLFARLSGFFGGLAVLLACIGLYGLMAYAVARRTSEIGIRMALGADPRVILRKIMREAMAMAFLGVVIGVPIAVAASRLISSFLYNLKPSDPHTIALAAGGVVAATALAGFLPARRAAKVDPMAALRHE